MGSGGYKSVITKWAKMESDILGKGITVELINWPEREKKWFFALGGRLDLETGKLVHGPKLQRAVEKFAYARNTVASGVFKTNREKDELKYALENAEHGGHTRGYEAISWEHSFPRDKDTYRSH
jgi:hypothetical protein